jgi:hypothetical protein
VSRRQSRDAQHPQRGARRREIGESKSTIRSFDLAHLGHLEPLTPKPEKSLDFFVNVMGMTETARKGDSVYLRGWDDYEHHTPADGVERGGHGPLRVSHVEP